MRLRAIEGNAQMLDGGAMFGNCPRAVWERWAPPDDRHRIRLACRALLVDEGRRRVLCEAGIGAFFEPKLRDRYGVTEERHVLLESLAAEGLAPEQIDVIVLSHLHFDHAGGVLTPWKAGEALALAFPNAAYVVGRRAWERANAPHARDRASFVPELQALLRERHAAGKVELVDGERSDLLGEAYRFTFSEGHTPGLMLTRVEGWEQGPVTFLGDLVPGAPWVHLPITMGYDRYPELLIDEKQRVLDAIVAEEGWAFFTHDPDVALAKVARDERGKYAAVETRKSLS